MKLGDKVIFRKELKRHVNTRTLASIQFALDNGLTYYYFDKYQTVESYKDSTMLDGYKAASNYGVFDNGKVLKGIYCGKRLIDMTGQTESGDDGCSYEFGKRLTVYLIATSEMGFHRVPETFIIQRGT